MVNKFGLTAACCGPLGERRILSVLKEKRIKSLVEVIFPGEAWCNGPEVGNFTSASLEGG